uniref:Uncharacterized protein n=1 Tax=Anopheles melas TaxID=34690 RepID=A0A182U6V5_9DIPT
MVQLKPQQTSLASKLVVQHHQCGPSLSDCLELEAAGQPKGLAIKGTWRYVIPIHRILNFELASAFRCVPNIRQLCAAAAAAPYEHSSHGADFGLWLPKVART